MQTDLARVSREVEVLMDRVTALESRAQADPCVECHHWPCNCVDNALKAQGDRLDEFEGRTARMIEAARDALSAEADSRIDANKAQAEYMRASTASTAASAVAAAERHADIMGEFKRQGEAMERIAGALENLHAASTVQGTSKLASNSVDWQARAEKAETDLATARAVIVRWESERAALLAVAEAARAYLSGPVVDAPHDRMALARALDALDKVRAP
jgi:hypothetical protein